MARQKKDRTVTRAAAEAAVRTLLSWAGDDPMREGLRDTPKRVVDAYGDSDMTALKEYLGDIEKKKMPHTPIKAAYEANVLVLIANEAILKNQRIALNADMFKLV